jgi:hypothetical protein
MYGTVEFAPFDGALRENAMVTCRLPLQIRRRGREVIMTSSAPLSGLSK